MHVKHSNRWIRCVVPLLATMSLSTLLACAHSQVARGCVGINSAVRAEVASGSLRHHNPATFAWLKEEDKACAGLWPGSPHRP